eukprot:scaffold64387_cov64-Phaeocystis_antarctica.AAC.3
MVNLTTPLTGPARAPFSPLQNASIGVGVLEPRAQQVDRHVALAALAATGALSALAVHVTVDLEALLKELLDKAARLLRAVRRGRRDAGLDTELRRKSEQRAPPHRARLGAGLAQEQPRLVEARASELDVLGPKGLKPQRARPRQRANRLVELPRRLVHLRLRVAHGHELQAASAVQPRRERLGLGEGG